MQTTNQTTAAQQAQQAEQAGHFMEMRSLKAGEYFKRTATAKRVYIKGDYCKARKVFDCQAADDINQYTAAKADRLVFVGFTY
jgi:hypothetical protein